MRTGAPARRDTRGMRSVGRIGLTLLLAAGILAGAGAASAAAPAPAPTLVDGDAAAVLKAVRAPGAKAVIVNLWASWCGPCREEFPDVLKVARELKPRGVRLVLVSGDFDAGRADAITFLKEHGVEGATFIKKGADGEFIDGLAPAWSGAMPATLIFDGAGKMQHLHEGKVTYDELKKLVLEVVESPGVRPAKENGS